MRLVLDFVLSGIIKLIDTEHLVQIQTVRNSVCVFLIELFLTNIQGHKYNFLVNLIIISTLFLFCPLNFPVDTDSVRLWFIYGEQVFASLKERDL